MSAISSLLRTGASLPSTAEFEEQIRQFEQRLQRETGARMEAERLLAERTADFARELSSAYRYLAERTADQQGPAKDRLASAAEPSDADPLTNLPARRRFQRDLATAVARATASGGKLALIVLDIDRLKLVNDMHGRACGDAVLEQTAERLLRRIDNQRLYRIGGDKFAAITDGVDDVHAALGIAERLRQAFAEPFQVAARLINCTVSVGVALYPEQAHNAGDLQRAAELAMQRVRSRHRDGILLFTRDLLDDFDSRRQLERDLRVAIRQGALDVHFQPIVDCTTGRIVAVEALARWRNGVAGKVEPDVFIPLAEEIGVIRELDLAVLEKTASAARRWLDTGAIEYFTVNLSSRHLQEVEVVADVLGALGRAGIEPARLMLELTESLLIDDTPAVGAAIAALRGAGARFALDDFGSGYSNLSYLRRLPLEKLKIDRSFVTDIETSDAARAIIEHVVGLAHRLGLDVVVEGVETEAQLGFLRSVGADLAQGYYFHAPSPAEAVDRLLAAQLGNRLDARHEPG